MRSRESAFSGAKVPFLIGVVVLCVTLQAPPARAANRVEMYLGAGALDVAPPGTKEVGGTLYDAEVRLLPSSWKGFSTMLGFMKTAHHSRAVYAGAGYRYYVLPSLFAQFSLGGAGYTKGQSKDLGSDLLFYLAGTVGYQFGKHWIAAGEVNHMSNAGLANINPGIDNVLFKIGFAF